MAEHLTAYKFIIIKRVHNKKVIKLIVSRKKYPYRMYFEYLVPDPQPPILHKHPEWLKEFVDKLNRKEIKFLS